jgi:transposase
MRGKDAAAGSPFSYVDIEKRVGAGHPLRVIREIVNATLSAMSVEFDALYSRFGRESIPPERLLRALLLQAFYTIRSERQLVERIEFDLLFPWFVGLSVDDPVWDATTFNKSRDRLLAGEVATKFLAAVLAHPKVKVLLSGEHFSVDGTLLEACASNKSFRPKDGSGAPPIRGGMVIRTSTDESAATTRTLPPPAPMRVSIARATPRRRNSASWVMLLWRTATG